MTNEELNTALYILHRKADVDRGAASGVGLLHDYRSRFFPAFFRHAQPTFLCS